MRHERSILRSFWNAGGSGDFSLEVVSIGVLYYAALVPCVFSSFLAVGIARAAGLEGEHFPVEMIPALDLKAMGLLVLLGILCAAVSILFCVLLHTAEHAYRKYFQTPECGSWLAASFLSPLPFYQEPEITAAAVWD